MKKVMISQPMRGISEEDIKNTRARVRALLVEQGYEVIDSHIKFRLHYESDVKNPPIYYLALSILYMSLCDIVYFCKGWEKARGCRVEHEIANAYGLQIIYE